MNWMARPSWRMDGFAAHIILAVIPKFRQRAS